MYEDIVEIINSKYRKKSVSAQNKQHRDEYEYMFSFHIERKIASDPDSNTESEQVSKWKAAQLIEKQKETMTERKVENRWKEERRTETDR